MQHLQEGRTPSHFGEVVSEGNLFIEFELGQGEREKIHAKTGTVKRRSIYGLTCFFDVLVC
jgi:hypothetical protein